MFHIVKFTILFCFIVQLQTNLVNANLGENFLLGKSAFYFPGPRQENKTTDGNLTTYKSSDWANHYVWISVNMAKQVEISSIQLTMKKHKHHATNFSVYVSNHFFICEMNSPDVRQSWKLCKTFENVNVSEKGVIYSPCNSPVVGQHVIVVYGDPYQPQQLPTKVLSFYEIEAFGKLINSKPYFYETEFVSKLPSRKIIMPIRESIMGDAEKIRVFKSTEISFVDANSESLIWDSYYQNPLMVATKFGDGRLITVANDQLIKSIMSNMGNISVWERMKIWLGPKTNGELRNITDTYKEGDIVLCLGDVNPNANQIQEAIKKLKSGKISLIFGTDINKIANLTTRPEYEICKASNVFITQQWIIKKETATITLTSKTSDDFQCALGVARRLELSVKYPELLAKCRYRWNALSDQVFQKKFNFHESRYRKLVLNVLLEHQDLAKFHAPCDRNRLGGNATIQNFINGYMILMKLPWLRNSGFKAPAVADFPGDIPSTSIVREKVTLRFVSDTHFRESFPTGLYLPPGDTLHFDVSQNSDPKSLKNWNIRIGCHTDDIYSDWTYSRFPSVSLEVSMESKTVYSPFGGVIWISPNARFDNISITFFNAVRAPFYNYRDTNNAEMKYEKSKQSPAPWMEFAGDAITTCVPSWSIQSISGELMKNITEIWDRVVKFSLHNSGYEFRTEGRTRLTMDIQPRQGSYAHAGYPIVGSLYSVSRVILNYQKLSGGDFWAVPHEIGHNLQNWNFTWGGFDDVTNNLFVLMGQQYLFNMDHEKRNYSKLYSKGLTEMARTYLLNATYSKFRGSSMHMGLQFFNHIKLCYGWGLFQKTLKKFAIRDLPTQKGLNQYDKMLIVMSETSGYNLAPIFDYWAIPITGMAKNITSQFPCVMPVYDHYTNMSQNQVNKIIGQYGSCLCKCPTPIPVTFPDFSKWPNNVIEE